MFFLFCFLIRKQGRKKGKKEKKSHKILNEGKKTEEGALLGSFKYNRCSSMECIHRS